MEQRGVLEQYYPLLYKLIGCPQPVESHPEGDAWEHTLMVVDVAAILRSQAKFPEIFMFAALIHDIAKPQTTVVGAVPA